MHHPRAHRPRVPRWRTFPWRILPRRILPRRMNRCQARKSSCQTSQLNCPLKSNGLAPPAVIEGAKLNTARQTKARKRRKGRRKSPRVSPPWPLTRRPRRLKSERWNCRYWRTTARAVISFSTTCRNGAAAATQGIWSPASQSLAQASSSSHSRHGNWSWRNRARA